MAKLRVLSAAFIFVTAACGTTTSSTASPSGRALRAILLATPAGGFTPIQGAPGADDFGLTSLPPLLALHRSELTADGFLHGVGQSWASPSGGSVLSIEIYSFHEHAGAEAFARPLRVLTTAANGQSYASPIPLPRIPDASAQTSVAGEGYSTAVFVKDDFVVTVDLSFPQKVDSRLLQDVALSQWQKVP